jgi:hypothetical protein
MALQCRKAEPASASMREKLEALAAEKAGTTNGFLLAKTAEEAEIFAKLKTIKAGAWFEFEDGKRVKLIRVNSKTNYYMLVNQQGKKADLIHYSQLADDILSGRTRIVAESNTCFIERALEYIHHNLNQ